MIHYMITRPYRGSQSTQYFDYVTISQKRTDTTHIPRQEEREHSLLITIRCTPSSSAHASYEGYGCNKTKPPWPPHRNTMIDVRV